jgi:hypothetical protein
MQKRAAQSAVIIITFILALNIVFFGCKKFDKGTKENPSPEVSAQIENFSPCRKMSALN